MSLMHDRLTGAIGIDGRRWAAGWGVRAATVLALTAFVLSGALIWLTLSRPLDVVGAFAGEDAWHVARALGRLIAGTAIRLATWL
jgi:hypothetical protein